MRGFGTSALTLTVRCECDKSVHVRVVEIKLVGSRRCVVSCLVCTMHSCCMHKKYLKISVYTLFDH